MKVSRKQFSRNVTPDTNPDVSYLDQEGFETSKDDYVEGRLSYVGVSAYVDLNIPYGSTGTFIEHQVATPGMWGVEVYGSPDDEKHLADMFKDECVVLEHMLTTLGVTVTDDD